MWRIAGVRPRVLGLILAMQALLIGWVADSEIARSVYLICYSLMIPAVLYLLLLRLLGRWLPFERQEIMLVYIVLTATLPVMGFGGMRFLLPGMGFLPYFSETQPQWAAYLPHLAGLPLLQDPAAIQALYRGHSPVPWQAWAVPILFWSVYLLLLSAVWLGLAAVLHRIWIRQERLAFPITVLPLQLTDPHDDLFRRGLFWAGFAVPAVLQSLLALHEWYPVVPAFQLKALDVRPLIFPAPPWDAIPNLQIGFQPIAIGLAYFVPGGVSFSCWFFWLVTKFSHVAGALVGWGAGAPGGQAGVAARFPFREEQAAGAWIAFAALAVWGARSHWAGLMRDAAPDERRDLRRWGRAGAGCLLLCAGLLAAVGIAPLAALGIVTVYVAFVLAGARVRAEAGGQWTMAPTLWTPHRVTNAFLGTQGISERSLVAGGHFDLVHVDIRGQSLPYLLEGLKIADVLGIRWRTVLVWVAIGTLTALALGWWSSLSQFYALGAATAKANTYALTKAQISMREMHGLASSRMPWDREGVGAMLCAGGFTWLLAWLRVRFLSFPLHPVGYVLCNTYTMNAFFVPFLLAWTVKVLVLRWGGSALYRRSVPLFVGLILGDIVIQAAWTFLGKWLDLHMLVLLGARERAAAQYGALFEAAGFRLTRVVPTPPRPTPGGPHPVCYPPPATPSRRPGAECPRPAQPNHSYAHSPAIAHQPSASSKTRICPPM